MKTREFSFLIFLGVLFLPNVAYPAADLSGWLYNLSLQVPPLIKLLVAISYVSGFGFLIGAVMKLKRCAQSMTMMSTQERLSGPLIDLLVGAALLYFADFVQIGSETLFGEGAALAYQSGTGGNSMFTSFIEPIILIIRLIGYIAFMKGLYILSSVGGAQAQPGKLGKGLVHLFGGILAINIEATYLVLLHTLQGPGIN